MARPHRSGTWPLAANSRLRSAGTRLAFVRRTRAFELSAALAVVAMIVPLHAHAQRPALALDDPGGGVEPVEVATVVPRETPPSTSTEEPLEELAIPEPPGAATRAQEEDDVRYPIPVPGRFTSDEPSIRIPSRISTRLRSLDGNLQALSARGGSNVVTAVLALLTGGLSITLGAVRPNPVDEMSIYLYVYGGIAAGRGVLELALKPNAQSAAITFQHMPMTSREEVRERLEFGERALEGLAQQSLIARVLDASLNLGAGVAVVPIFAAKDFAIGDPLDYFVLIGAGVSIVSGIVTLASTSPAEQRWTAYRALRERLREERREELARERGRERAEERDEDDELAALERVLFQPSGPSVRFGLTGLSVTF